MIKYYPYKSDKPNKKYFIITNDNKKVYFGQASASDFTIHKDEARKQRYINRHKIMKCGLNQELKSRVLESLVVMESSNNKFKLSRY
jgi:hypothetical protein